MEKYLQVKATNPEILEKAENGGAVTSLLKFLLESNTVEGVLNIKKEKDVYDGIPTFTTDADELIETAGSLHCAPTMISDIIARHLKDEKIAVTTKPCDAMAIDEIIKRCGINRDNVYMIGLNCGGTVQPIVAEKMIKLFYDINPEEVVSEEINKGKFIVELADGTEKSVKIDDLEDEGYGRRENCQRCELKIPRKADVACGNWGSSKGYTFVEINTPKGEQLIQNAIDNGYIEAKEASEKQIKIRKKVENIMIKMAKKTQKKQLINEYPDEMSEIFTRCLKCYRCRDVCPVCNCKVCSLEKPYYEEDPFAEPDPLMLHAIRMGHMAFSCINCGQCEDVCPMEIPLSKIFQKVQLKYREETGYISGVTEDKPMMYSGEKEEIVE
ncbi:Coenzyme F420 hydrogenase/dehydrogenase, beta subunit C-terminal domain [uncultured Methanosphaera sp.]|uniref:Coenzyme F420 hydrogenase/dehydrogenase, beta subunit C-terminal domain n=3 Tax=Methanosphaera TaxID=2316 RepID=UPI000DC2250B|nr:Coenzyme F420 hydrogenase/dehydrogenase, beta subunit C-terminal domain [uncultured Methanosphaera sp.]MDD6286456.1 Coenzyme F420 hydrogenase/dehydrogenase, beta subunit C-terminal domain [Methanobacteriaceae archaeon]MDY2744145.1 Coenzyme F420 hydrogenase/dehydrogenase, beta subunit C-terminal domain [Methanosphaera sp.]RAP45006.1 MAG: formate dehydrogenase [Methanosphaera sp. SHI1033]